MVMNSLEFSRLFLDAADKMDLTKDFDNIQDFKEMGYWWQSRHLQDFRFQRLISTPFFIALVFFPYYIYAWRKYYKQNENFRWSVQKLKLNKRDSTIVS